MLLCVLSCVFQACTHKFSVTGLDAVRQNLFPIQWFPLLVLGGRRSEDNVQGVRSWLLPCGSQECVGRVEAEIKLRLSGVVASTFTR